MAHFLPTALLAMVFFHGSLCAQQSGLHNSTSPQNISPTYFQDCTVLDFGEQDMSTMTEAEKIQALDDSFFGALNQSEDCMNAAAQSSAQSVASAAGQGAGQGAGAGSASSTSSSGAGQSSSQSTTETQESSTNTRTSTTTDSSKQSVGSPAKGGSSAVCDAVIAGLEGATTESEKAHFEALKEQYGCK